MFDIQEEIIRLAENGDLTAEEIHSLAKTLEISELDMVGHVAELFRRGLLKYTDGGDFTATRVGLKKAVSWRYGMEASQQEVVVRGAIPFAASIFYAANTESVVTGEQIVKAAAVCKLTEEEALNITIGLVQMGLLKRIDTGLFTKGGE